MVVARWPTPVAPLDPRPQAIAEVAELAEQRLPAAAQRVQLRIEVSELGEQ